jgi:hypothetical protein
MPVPRFEVVVRVVRDNPEKKDEPVGRDVLYEVPFPVVTEWNYEYPRDLSPEAVIAMTDLSIQVNMAAPMIEQMKKAPLGVMLVQCIQGLQAKMVQERLPHSPTSPEKK